MSREIFEIVQGMDLKNIETQLALQCAPLITGLKISNMLIVSNEDEKLVRAILKRTGISCYRLLQNEKKITLLLFRRNQLEKFLEREDVSEVLREEGYVEIQLGRILSIFQMRYRAYMNGSKIFPHEMGLLLGYPVEDVTVLWCMEERILCIPDIGKFMQTSQKNLRFSSSLRWQKRCSSGLFQAVSVWKKL